MAESLAALQVSLELQSAQFTAEMQKVNGQLNRLNKDVRGISAGFTKMGNVLKGAAVLGAFTALASGMKSLVGGFSSVIDSMDEMSKASQKIGVAVETLTSLKFAAEQSGVEFEALQTGLKKLNQNLSDFDTGTNEAAEALRKMGIAIGDSTEQALGKIADRFAEMPDGVQKTATAMAIFGKAGADLVPLLNAGADGIEALQERAKELGIVFDDITAKQAELFNDKMAELKTVFTGIVTQISIGLLPALSATVDAFANSAKVSGDWQKVGKALGITILDVAIATVEATKTLGAMIDNVRTFAQTAAALAKVVSFLPTGDRLGAGKEAIAGIEKIFFGSTKAVETGSDVLLGALKTARENVLNGVVDFESSLKTGGAGGGAGGGGAGKLGLFDTWVEGLKKAQEEAELLGPKMKFLTTALGELEAAGQKGTEQWRVYTEEMKKIEEMASKGSVGAELTLQIEKMREETAKAAEQMTILAQKYADFLAQGDTEGALIVAKMMDDLKGKTKETATEMEKLGESITDAIASNANNAVNSFIDSIGTAKISFGDFAASVLKDIAKMIVQLLIMKPLMDSIKGFMGFGAKAANGLAFAGGTSLPQGVYTTPHVFKFANGGAFGGSRTGLMGEAGPEAIVPLKRHGAKLGVSSSPVNITVNNNAGVDVETKATENADGSKQIDIYIEKKVRDMVNGGGLDRAMRGAYGLSRVGA